MDNKIFNGQSSMSSVATSTENQFNSIIVSVGLTGPDTLKFNLRKYGFMELGGGLCVSENPSDDSTLRVIYPNGNVFYIVKNHSIGSRCNWKFVAEQVRQIVCRHYNVPNPDKFPTFNDWAENLKEYGFCDSEKRWAKVMAMCGKSI